MLLNFIPKQEGEEDHIDVVDPTAEGHLSGIERLWSFEKGSLCLKSSRRYLRRPLEE